MCHIDEYVDPAGYGMDAAAGFPPNPLGWWLPDMGATTVKLDPKSVGRRLSYDMMASQACALPRTEYTFFHGVCPGWDNEPRQPARGACFLGSSPPSYASWLNHACRRTLDERQGEERIVFINAWNEWGEGAHLEPDRHYGYAYLASTARVLNELDCPANMNTTNPIKPANPEGTESKRIHTSFGSILYIDEMTLKLRHGPILTSPQNVHFVSQGDEGIFKYVSNGISRNIEFKGEHGYAVDSGTIENSSPPATRFVIVRNSSGFLGLKSKEQFLSADPDGEIRINKPHFRKWEYFWLIL